ncbi:MAG: hypothetical protein NT159_23365 [Proteobacteria bacterium]|nr:hypothetical protein [Pseudomonadota bacterium]
MQQELSNIRIGLALVLLCLMMGIGMGISFGVNENLYQNFISEGIAAHPELHDAASQGVIWRWALRAHFHAAGIGAFALGLVILVALSGMSDGRKRITALLVGLAGLYPMAWFVMFYLAPSLGRKATRQHWLVEALTYISVGGLLLGMLSLLVGLFIRSRSRR